MRLFVQKWDDIFEEGNKSIDEFLLQKTPRGMMLDIQRNIIIRFLHSSECYVTRIDKKPSGLWTPSSVKKDKILSKIDDNSWFRSRFFMAVA